jgi:hypothetical protein
LSNQFQQHASCNTSLLQSYSSFQSSERFLICTGT